MEVLSRRKIPFVAADVLLILLCCLHLPALFSRARAPFLAEMEGDHARIFRLLDVDAAPGVDVGMELVSVEAHPVSQPEVLDYIADGRRIGDTLIVGVRRSGIAFGAPVRLIPYYRPGEIIVFFIVGFATWLVGLFVLLNGPPGTTTAVLHGAMMSMAAVVMLAWEGFTPDALLPWTLMDVLFFLSYAMVAACFFHFTRLFPARLRPQGDPAIVLVYLLAILSVGAAVMTHWRAYQALSVEAYLTYSLWFDLFHIVVFMIILAGIANFVMQYRRAGEWTERRKLQWLLLGLLLGPTPFFFLTVLPGMFAPALAVPEHLSLISLVVIPVAFAVSFIRYRILDISLVLNRTTVYVVAVGLILLVYAGLVAAVTSVVGYYVPWAAAAAAVLVALLFEPARRQVQSFVDRRFFRVEYDFRKAERALVDSIKNRPSVQILADALVRETESLIPVRRIGFFTLNQSSGRLRCAAHRNFDLLERRGIRFEPENLKTRLTVPVALDDRVEPGVRYEPADRTVFARWGMEIVFPILSDAGGFLGFLVLGGKRSDARFTVEDVDLLSNICTHAGLEIQRVTLQHDLVQKEAEARQLAELNELKSDFVSYVSHEFRSPLTSIKMFAELLQSPKQRLSGKKREFVEVIQGEAERLERMVSTVLDSAKIESGVQIYTPERMDLRAAVRESLLAMDYQLKKHEFTVVTRIGNGRAFIDADRAAVGQAIRNLLSNAIKYHGARKHVTVSVAREGEWYVCEVKDRGLGIAEESLPHLFEKFYREHPTGNKIQGVGLGLPLVKHIMEAHGGRVEVTSTKDVGSAFRLVFPARSNGARTKTGDTDR
jgi:two-component system, OmpR family, phosphate regulon sensor histidine kinase PhoR